MAKKARFYEVERQNGHEKWTEVIAAPSKDHIESALNTADIKVNKIQSLGWAPVATQPDDSDSHHEFHAKVKGQEIVIRPQEPGYKYLTQQFHNQVQDVNSWIDEQN